MHTTYDWLSMVVGAQPTKKTGGLALCTPHTIGSDGVMFLLSMYAVTNDLLTVVL